MKSLRILHTVLSILLGAFFIYAGVEKFIPKPAPALPADNSAYITAFQNDQFESPLTFKMGVKALKVSGFLKLVGVLQILSGLLIILPVTRLTGLLLLLPVTTNIFCFHFFMDNRPGENAETGLYLLINILLAAYYYKLLKNLLITKRYSFN